jgi:hypothetical protein
MMIRSCLAFLTFALCAAVLGCGSHAPVWLPPRVSGQIPADYRLAQARGLVLARITVVTNDQRGFAGISNPLVLQLQLGDDDTNGTRTVTLMDSNAYVFTNPSSVPSLWHYEDTGLLAMSLTPGSYNGLAIAYPDRSHETATPDSIPYPSRAFTFAPVAIRPAAITYLGDIEIRQQYDSTDLFIGRVNVSYAVRDDYDRTVADFRARFPQFADVAVERRLVHATH